MTHFSKITALAAFIALPAAADTLDEARFQQLAQDAFGPVIAANDIPGIAIGLTIGGERHVYVHGLADRAAQAPVTAETLFELGSISKLFTVTLAALAEQEGRLELDAPVSRLRPGLAGGAFDRITLADLGAHATGGMPLQVPEAITEDADLRHWLAEWSPAADPATTRSYSNISIGLLGQIAGAALGGSYAEVVGTQLFPALGLHSTFIDVPQTQAARYAFGYRGDRPVRVNPGLLDDEAYGVKSTVTDMMQLLEANLGTAEVEPALTAALARTREPLYDTAFFAQSMIWEGYDWPPQAAALAAGNGPDMALKPQPITPHHGPDPAYLTKTGSTGGFGGYVALLPEEDLGLVVLANRTWPNPDRAAAGARLIEAVLAETR